MYDHQHASMEVQHASIEEVQHTTMAVHFYVTGKTEALCSSPYTYRRIRIKHPWDREPWNAAEEGGERLLCIRPQTACSICPPPRK